MNFVHAEKFRARHLLDFEHKSGDDYGWFVVPSKLRKGLNLRVMVAPSDEKWQHVSVSTGFGRCPLWEEMCQIKDLFFDVEEIAVQFHPKKSEYINNAPDCLHLWALNDGTEFPKPEKWMVGC